MKKSFVLAPYQPNPSRSAGVAMYESTDSRLLGNQTYGGGGRIIPGTIAIAEHGTFKRDKAAKGLFNGREIGFFNTVSGKVYLVFSDYSVREHVQA